MIKISMDGPTSRGRDAQTPFNDGFLSVCSTAVREILYHLPPKIFDDIQELRIRQGKPINIQCREGEYFATASGKITDNHLAAYRVDRDDVQEIFQNITRNSVYALDEELRNGYITIPGGHRGLYR